MVSPTYLAFLERDDAFLTAFLGAFLAALETFLGAFLAGAFLAAVARARAKRKEIEG